MTDALLPTPSLAKAVGEGHLAWSARSALYAHPFARYRAACPRRRRLGRRHVPDLCLPAAGAGHAGAAAADAIDAGDAGAILPLRLGRDPADPGQRLLDAVRHLRRLLRRRHVHPLDAIIRL